VKAKVDAIIVAAGKGVRMDESLRKQYIALAGIPILTRTLNIFDRCDRISRIIVVVPEADLDFCRNEILRGEAPGFSI
jgi:2-C-methyl-D-erythritol 4-phosphate cytidylyltransferase